MEEFLENLCRTIGLQLYSGTLTFASPAAWIGEEADLSSMDKILYECLSLLASETAGVSVIGG